MKKLIILFVITLAFMVAGCTQEKKEEVKTVEYYKEHKEELQVTLTKCNDNPAVVDSDPNCINASRAHAQTLMQFNYKPMKAEEKNKY